MLVVAYKSPHDIRRGVSRSWQSCATIRRDQVRCGHTGILGLPPASCLLWHGSCL